MGPFDLVVIGGGPGGYLCAERAAQGGLKTALIEGRRLGGTCLNEGCIPTKTLLHSAKMYRHATESAAYGVTAENVRYDHARVIDRKNEVVDMLVSGVRAARRAGKITVVQAKAEIRGRNADGFQIKAGDEDVVGRRLVIATGSETVVPPIPGLKEGLESGFVITNREMLSERELPGKLVVMGGGVIGLEMAIYYASVGTKVTVVEMLPKIAGPTDDDISKALLEDCRKHGMEFRLGCKVLEIREGTVVYEENGERKEEPCDKALLSLGRRPRTAGLGLETLGIEMDRAAIVTDRHMCTNVAGVYAVGDCNGKFMLAHTAYREADVAVNHMLGKPDEMRYESVASVIYTDPEIASVGETAASAKAKGIKVKEVVLPLIYSGRYVAENEGGDGFVKLVTDLDKKRLIGVHMIGSYASEIILSAAMMVDTELPPERLKKLVFPHPSVGEVIRDALFQI